MEKLKWLLAQRQRAYLYRVLTAVGLILVAKGVLTEGELQLFDSLATVVLGVAAANTPTSED